VKFEPRGVLQGIQRRLQDLERDPAIESELKGLVNDGEPPFRDVPFDAESAVEELPLQVEKLGSCRRSAHLSPIRTTGFSTVNAPSRRARESLSVAVRTLDAREQAPRRAVGASTAAAT
jgi:hypothetical protein